MTAFFALRVPHRGEPTATPYHSQAEYISAMYRAAERYDRPMYDVTTAGLLRCLVDIGALFGAEERDFLRGLPGRTTLYRAGWLGNAYTTEPIDEFEAAKAFDFHDLSHGEIVTIADVPRCLAYLRGEAAPRIGLRGPRAAADALESAAAHES